MKYGIQISKKRKEIFIYCVAMAMLLFLLKWLEAHFIVFNYRLDIFIGTLAILFTILGIWLALKLVKPKIETHIIEKEVFIDNQAQNEINLKEIENSGLSKRELEVLQLMEKGLSNEEIAAKLFIGINTVKTHTSNIFLKLDVKRRTQAIEKAKRIKLIN